MVLDTDDRELIAARECSAGLDGGFAVMARMMKKERPDKERQEFAEKVVSELPDARVCVDMLSVLKGRSDG